MRSHSFRLVFLAAVALLVATTAWAQSPQTITVDGVNDFLLANRVDEDGGDTQHTPIDIGDVYVTNDANNLFIGFDHDQDGWGTVQLGIAIDVGTADGGTNDPWGRAIEWTMAPNKPDFMFYVNLDNNWQAGYSWSGAAWTDMVTAGPGALGWSVSTGFDEIGMLLSSLGVSATDVINIECWVTQDGGTKGPLDLVAGDAFQLSTPTSTTWDTATPIPLMDMFAYTVQAAADPDPPVIADFDPTSFPAESFFDVYFNEPVDGVTSDVPGNYTITGGATVISATRDASELNVVHLELDSALAPSTSLYQLVVTNVEDGAGNPIVADGVGNTIAFMLKQVYFRGLMGPYLDNASSPPDEFSVEGDTSPLTFGATCDTGIMADTGTDDIWEYDTVFCVIGDYGAGTAEAEVQWKFVHNCSTYEPLASNRLYQLSLTTAAIDTIEVWWADEDPSQFIAHDIDVEFFVDMNEFAPDVDDTVSINGDVPPLTHDVPSANEMVDDGTGNDAVAGDGIYSTLITFPAGAKKDATYKFLFNSTYECLGQGDRTLFLNDELYDTVGGTLGPLTLPLVHYDACTVTWNGVEVVFSVDLNATAWEGMLPGDVITINGTESTDELVPTLTWEVPSINVLADDGVAPDAVAGDLIFTTAVVFPDSSWINTEYKYLYNDVYECADFGNRTFTIDADNYDDAGNPQVLPTDKFQNCFISGIEVVPQRSLVLEQNQPNPFNPKTVIHYTVNRAGSGSLRIFNIKGELVRTLFAGDFEAGQSSMTWDGRASDGKVVASGVYIYRLEVGGDSDSRRMMLLK